MERLQKEREKQVGVVKEGMDYLPQNGYSMYSKFRSIEKQENEYKKFRETLKTKRKTLSELDNMDEMINDFNYMMFHQHLFGQLNEFELAKRDLLYNSPGLDMLI